MPATEEMRSIYEVRLYKKTRRVLALFRVFFYLSESGDCRDEIATKWLWMFLVAGRLHVSGCFCVIAGIYWMPATEEMRSIYEVRLYQKTRRVLALFRVFF